jgi:riboflavin synthase
VGDRVNLEADLLAKYTERLLLARGAASLDAGWLAEHGWG